MSYFEPVADPYSQPVSYFENYDRYRYEDPEFPGAPLKEDWWWELNKPTSDAQVSSRVKSVFPFNDFYNDAAMALDPQVRNALAEVYVAGDKDYLGAVNAANQPDFQERLRKQIGKKEWNRLREAGILPEDDLPGEQLDDMAVDYYMQGIDSALAQGSPSARRNLGFWDYGSERFGGRPYPGGELPGFGGPGFEQPAGGPGGAPGGATAAGGGAAGNAGTGMPDDDMMQRLDDAVVRNPGLAESPRNAYRAALESRLRARGYRGAGRERSGRNNTARYFRENAQKEGSRQQRRDVAQFFGSGVRNMNSRPSGRRSSKLSSSNRRTRPSSGNRRTGRSIASYYARRS